MGKVGDERLEIGGGTGVEIGGGVGVGGSTKGKTECTCEMFHELKQ